MNHDYKSYDENFTDYISCTENNIIQVTDEGISLIDGGFIDFRECAANFYKAHGGSGFCVAERNGLRFIFYTSPKATCLFFLPKSKFKEFFSKKPTRQRFYGLQKKIIECNYRTYDMN